MLKAHSLNLVKLRNLCSMTARLVNQNTETKVKATLKSWKDIPGPTTLPLIGPLHHFLPGGNLYNLNSVDLITKLHDQYGPIVRLSHAIGMDTYIFVFDAESVSQILRGENNSPIRPGLETQDYYRKYIKPSNKRGQPILGLNSTDQALWQEFRSIMNPLFLRTSNITPYADSVEDIVMDMISRIKTTRDEKFMLKCDIKKELDLFALEVVSLIVLGSRIGCLDPNFQESSTVRQFIECTQETLKLAIQLDFYPSIWKYVSTPNYKRLMYLYMLHESLAKNLINKSILEINKKNEQSHEKNILQKLLEIDEEIAPVMATDMLFAGVDSVSNTISTTLYFLAMNPEKQNKLREELRSNNKMKPYLSACLKESMRIMPITPFNLRTTTKKFNILGYEIPANVVFGHRNMSLMEEHFPRSKEYIPERWLVGKEDPLCYKNANPFASNPFGFGPRSCLGRRIAEMELKLFLSRAVENFQIGWSGPPPKFKHDSLVQLTGLNFIFKDVP